MEAVDPQARIPRFGRRAGKRPNITPHLRHLGQADNSPPSLEIPTLSEISVPLSFTSSCPSNFFPRWPIRA